MFNENAKVAKVDRLRGAALSAAHIGYKLIPIRPVNNTPISTTIVTGTVSNTKTLEIISTCCSRLKVFAKSRIECRQGGAQPAPAVLLLPPLLLLSL
jgi:hypothetical protein